MIILFGMKSIKINNAIDINLLQGKPHPVWGWVITPQGWRFYRTKRKQKPNHRGSSQKKKEKETNQQLQMHNGQKKNCSWVCYPWCYLLSSLSCWWVRLKQLRWWRPGPALWGWVRASADNADITKSTCVKAAYIACLVEDMTSWDVRLPSVIVQTDWSLWDGIMYTMMRCDACWDKIYLELWL